MANSFNPEDDCCKSSSAMQERRVSCWSTQGGAAAPANASQFLFRKKPSQKILNIVTTEVLEEKITKLKEKHQKKVATLSMELNYLRERIPHFPIKQLSTRITKALHLNTNIEQCTRSIQYPDVS